MGRTIPALAFAAAALATAPVRGLAQADCGPARIGYVQRVAVLAMLPRYATRDTELNVDIEAYKFEVSQQQGKLDSAASAFRAKSALLSASAGALEYQKLQAAAAQIQRDVAAMQQKVAAKRQALYRPLDARVQATLDSIRIELKCSIVIDPTASTGVVSVNKAFDLTQRLIDRLTVARDTALFGPPLPGAKKPPRPR